MRSRAARGEDFARGHHAFLVGQAHRLAGQDGGVGGLKAGHAHDGRNHKIRLGQGGAGNRACGAVNHFDAGDAGLLEASGKLAGQLFGGQRDQLRPPADGLRKGFVEVAPGGQRGHLVAVRKLLDDGEGALADGAGGTENGESFQGIFLILEPVMTVSKARNRQNRW